jgi:hypothetical protein
MICSDRKHGIFEHKKGLGIFFTIIWALWMKMVNFLLNLNDILVLNDTY